MGTTKLTAIHVKLKTESFDNMFFIHLKKQHAGVLGWPLKILQSPYTLKSVCQVPVACLFAQTGASSQLLMRHLSFSLNLVDYCSAKKWKLWKQTWINYARVLKITSQDEYQKALFLCTFCQPEGALEIFNAFRHTTGEDPDEVNTIIPKFDEYFTGEINETYMNALN